MAKKDVGPLVEAVMGGNLALVKQLVGDGLDPSQPAMGDFGPDHEEGIAAIHGAFTRKVAARVGAYLLTLPKLDWNVGDKLRRRPLHVLVARCAGPDTPARVTALVAAGADPNATDKWGRTPLFDVGFYYRTRGAIEVYDALVAAGADPDRTDKEGWTALDRLFEDMRVADKATPQRAALIQHAAGAKSRFTKDELALVADPNLLVNTRKANKANAATVARSWLALGRAYRRAGATQGEGCALDAVRMLSSEYEFPVPLSYKRGKDYWEVDVEGATVRVIAGKLGGKAKETVEKLADAKAALARAKELGEAQEKKFWG
jgi:hypothetical protein